MKNFFKNITDMISDIVGWIVSTEVSTIWLIFGCMMAFGSGAIIGMYSRPDIEEESFVEETVVSTEEQIPSTTEQEEIIKYEYITIEPEPEFAFTEEELNLMAGVVHAEAGNQDQLGKRLVVDCILNRVVNPEFPNTIKEVINQPNQFANPMEYTIDDMCAVELECQKRVDTNVLWFRTSYYSEYGTPLYQHGAHYFSGKE